MAKKLEFDATRKLSETFHFEDMSRMSEIMLALNVNIPFDVTNPAFVDCPAVDRDGVLFVDTEELKVRVRNAVDQHNPALVPETFGLRRAIEKIIAQEKSAQAVETLRDDPALAARVREALRGNKIED